MEGQENVTNLNQAVKGVSTEQEARALLLSAGIASVQSRAAFVPLMSDASLPETETQFSARTRATRQTFYSRITKWIHFITREWKLSPLSISYSQIEAVAYDKLQEAE